MHDIKHRSWGAFGDSVAGVGFCLIVFSIFLFIVQKLNVIICLLMLAAGVPLVVVGIRVARWDKTEEPKMTKIDPALSYRYLLCIGDKEEPLEDMAKLEQAYEAYCKERESFSVRITPPIGSLSEWKFYYDPKLKYVSMITLAKDGGKWGIFCDEPFEYDYKRLKKILVKKKKVRLDYFGRAEDMEIWKENPRQLYLEEYVKDTGFEVERTRQGFRVCSEKIPSAKHVREILMQLNENEYVFFWNYYHRTVSDPGSYVSAYIVNGNAIMQEGNHGWSGNYKRISMDDLVELILRNWDKDWDRAAEYKNAIHIRKTTNPKDILSTFGKTDQVYVPNYDETAW